MFLLFELRYNILYLYVHNISYCYTRRSEHTYNILCTYWIIIIIHPSWRDTILLYCPIARLQSRVECPLKSVQYQFAPMFMTVVFNPLAPGSGTGRHKSPGTTPSSPPFPRDPLCDAPGTRFSAGALRRPRNQLAKLTTDPDR